MNEWEFTAEVATWIKELLLKNPALPFSRAQCEQRGQGTRKRRDLTLFDKDEKVVLTGEIKLPYQQHGGTPYNAFVVKDARAKAQKAGSPFFFTWNVNDFILWETDPAKKTWQEHNYKPWEVTRVYRESDLELPPTRHALQKWLAAFLDEFAQISRGEVSLGVKSPDEKFIEALESALHLPILLTLEKLESLYSQPHVKLELDKWMRDEQGWIIYDDPEGIRENLERASKFACYALVNKLVFYEALLKRYGKKLQRFHILVHINTGEKLRLHLAKYFADAKTVTADYETVFVEDHYSLGNRIPFYSDAAVVHWAALINQIHEFDFSRLDYEVIGNIFERLIAPEERRKYGQFYTMVEVVDLINSFCIRRGDELVLDPACGGGTFLVRAYARKHELDPSRPHRQLLTDLFGVDTSRFATHLSTINLATRDLIDEENYPQIARGDFFEVKTHQTFLKLPQRLTAKGLGQGPPREIAIPALDAVVGNPPYIRQESIPQPKKKSYLQLVEDESNAFLSGRSDLHCFFWPHAKSFLKDDGWLCFLASSQWLDVEYGFRLQEWILTNFEIVAILESLDEPWFVGARVATAITILRRQKDEKARRNNLVRFVQLRRPLRELLAHDGTTVGALQAADQFREEILKPNGNVSHERYRLRLVRQGELWEQGVKLGRLMVKTKEDEEENNHLQNGDYFGGKWGVYLRAPDLWFNLLDELGDRFVPLADIAEIHRGITSGKDQFFFPKDCSAECLREEKNAGEFQLRFGVSRKEVVSGKVKLVRCGEELGEIWPIEAQYLEPEVHSLMEVDGFTIGPKDCARLILLVGKKKGALKGEYVLDYIKWGEKQNYHKGSTCAARTRENHEWYDLTGHDRGALFWPMIQQYKHAVAANDNNLICNHNLFDIAPKDKARGPLGGVLNSTLVVLSKFQFGRPVGVEGAYKTEVVDTKLMMVPDYRGATIKHQQRIAKAFENLKKRKVLQFLSERRMREMAYRQAGKEAELAKLSEQCELDMPNRRELDDAVLEMLGVSSPERRKGLIDALYSYLREFFEAVRQKEEKGIANKKRAKRKGAARPGEIAEQVYAFLAENHPEWLRRYDLDFLNRDKPFDTYELPVEGKAEPFGGLLGKNGAVFRKGKKALARIQINGVDQQDLLMVLAESGIRGLVRVPTEGPECRKVLHSYEKFVKERERKLIELIAERTADEEMQEKIYQALQGFLAQVKK